jgi:hypothetical protein
LQTWTADDFDHRLNAEKLASILKMAEPLLLDFQLPVEVKYGPEDVAQYVIRSVESNLTHATFVLGRKQTDHLARDKCGVSEWLLIRAFTFLR